MRYVRIFFLTFQQVFEQRGRSFVWFLISLWGPLITLLFWRGATNGGKTLIGGWSLQELSSYYFFMIIASSLLISNIEDDVSRFDIQLGNLTKYLTRPINYLHIKFIEDIPYRILKGIFGVIVCLVFFILLKGKFFIFAQDIATIFLAIIICVGGFLLSYMFKMILGVIAFWLIEVRGIYEAVDVTMFVFAGSVMPLSLLPHIIATIGYVLPFSYMIYFPIIAVEGKLSVMALCGVISVQAVWLLIFFLLYQFLWIRGIKKFSGVGQ